MCVVNWKGFEQSQHGELNGQDSLVLKIEITGLVTVYILHTSLLTQVWRRIYRDDLMKDLGHYCPKSFATAKREKEKWCHRKSNPGPLHDLSRQCSARGPRFDSSRTFTVNEISSVSEEFGYFILLTLAFELWNSNPLNSEAMFALTG